MFVIVFGGNNIVVYEVNICIGECEMVFVIEGYDIIGVLLLLCLVDGLKIVGYSYSDKEGLKCYYFDGEMNVL